MESIVRVLLVAPDQPGLDAIPEIRQISKKTHATILNGPVRRMDVFDYATRGYDIIHFATHGNEQGIELSDGFLTMSDIAAVARLARAVLVFFNSCNTGKPASFSVNHGVTWAIYSNVAIADNDAWQYVYTLYDALRGVEPHNVAEALSIADDGDGDYGFNVSPALLGKMTLALRDVHSAATGSALSQWQLAAVAFSAILTLVVALYIAISQFYG